MKGTEEIQKKTDQHGRLSPAKVFCGGLDAAEQSLRGHSENHPPPDPFGAYHAQNLREHVQCIQRKGLPSERLERIRHGRGGIQGLQKFWSNVRLRGGEGRAVLNQPKRTG